MRRALAISLALWISAGSTSVRGQEAETLHKVEEDLAALRIERAEQRLSTLERARGTSPALLVQQGMVQFYRGRYAAALELVDQALANAQERNDRTRFEEVRELLASTRQATAKLQPQRSESGRYVVYCSPGKDAIIAPYALSVLAAADEAVSARLGLRVPGPIRLEIYPSADALALVSALTVEQIETTGTIALSKWNRLMITTPRALVRGYPWADTITHEFVHMVISRITGDQAPVWLQEGTAKMLERAWRQVDNRMRLDPAARTLLAQAKYDDRLLTFEEMHPSIAMLPSQDAAALAFAEVATFMERYVDRYGDGALRAALSSIGRGADARNALAKAASIHFRQLETSWKASLPNDPMPKGPRHLELRLRKGATRSDEAQEVVRAPARRFMRLGDLLWDRGRWVAATAEYEKAAQEDPDDPIVGSRLARAALSAGQPARALQAVQRLSRRYPDHAPSQAMLGAARLATGDRPGAVSALREALYINPFDPQPHCDLAQATDDDAERARELSACEALRKAQ